MGARKKDNLTKDAGAQIEGKKPGVCVQIVERFRIPAAASRKDKDGARSGRGKQGQSEGGFEEQAVGGRPEGRIRSGEGVVCAGSGGRDVPQLKAERSAGRRSGKDEVEQASASVQWPRVMTGFRTGARSG